MGRKNYKWFNIGDEVYTSSNHCTTLTAGKPYTVVNCYKPSGFVDTTDIVHVQVINDLGNVGIYSSARFNKTESQVREDKG